MRRGARGDRSIGIRPRSLAVVLLVLASVVVAWAGPSGAPATAHAVGTESFDVTASTVLTLPATPSQVSDVSCPTADVCYVAAFPPAKTVDGGATWTVLGPDRYPTLLFSAIDCFDALRCIGFENNALMTTTDGGATWVRVQVSTTYSYSGPGACATPTSCIVIVNGGLGGVIALSTRNAGVDWTTSAPLGTLNQQVTDVECTTDGLCVAITPGSTHRSTDWGASWSTVATTSVSDVDCPPTGACFVVGAAGLTRITASGVTSGLAFVPGLPTAVACTAATSCVAMAQRFLPAAPFGTRWTDGQAPADAVATGDIGTVTFADCAGTTCIAVGERATYPRTESPLDYVLRSTDGGSTWSVLDPEPPRPRMNDLACASDSQCAWVGSDGRRLGPAFHEQGGAARYSTDGGSTWSPAQLPPGTNRLFDVECSAAGLCIASTQTDAVEAGLMRSTDAGASWSPVAGVAAPAVTPVSCSSSTRCIARGSTSSAPTATSWIWVTDDAGVTWRETWTGSENFYQSACADADHCIAQRGGGYVTSPMSFLRTSDGGETWTIESPPAPMKTVDPQLLACGAGRCFFATYTAGWISDDGGATWQSWSPTLGELALARFPDRSLACTARLCVTTGVYTPEIVFSEDRGLSFPTTTTTAGSGLAATFTCTPSSCFVFDRLPGVAQRVERLDFAPRGFRALKPARLLDTRPRPLASTVDGAFAGVGPVAAGSVLALPVRSRGGVSADASTVALNVTVTEAAGPGYVTVFPCGESPPLASNVNIDAGETVANAVTARVGSAGSVCFYSSTQTQLVVDVNGTSPAGVPSLTAITPQRLLETRVGPGLQTADRAFEGIGARPAGSVIELTVAGRGGVPSTAVTAVLNVTVTESDAPGYVTVYPCDGPPPNASQLNHRAGQTVANSVTARLSPRGTVCVFTLTRTHLVIDASAHAAPSITALTPLTPVRLLETRSGTGFATVDGRHQGVGPLGQASVYPLDVRGRGGVPADASAVVLNLTVVGPSAPGYVTVYPCGELPPTASNINFTAADVRANAVVVKIGTAGAVCLYTSTSTHVAVDVTAAWR